MADPSVRAAGRAARDARGGRARAAVRRPVPLLQPRVRAARHRRRARLGPAVPGLRPRAPVRAGRTDAGELRAGAAGSEGLPRAAVRRRRLGHDRRGDRRLGVRGPAVGDGRRHLPLGRVPRGSRRVRACLLERRGDADGAGDRRPRALAVGLWTRPGAVPRRRPDPRRPWRLDARIHRDARLLGGGEGRRHGAHERERGGHQRARRRAAGDDGRGVAGRARAVADRRAAARRRRPAARHLVHGGGAARVPLAGGKLEARFDGTPDWRPSSVFERETDDRWRTVSGPEHGEALRIVRAEDGSVERMVWAGYPVTREPGPWKAPD